MFTPSFQHPLPQGWSEHIGADGQPFYYNELTHKSTYLRPVPSIYGQAYSVTKEKEKPIFKQHILGTDWHRITTSEGNIFYFHKITKQSVWSVPDELKTVAVKAQEEGALTSHSSNQSTDAKRKANEPVSIDEIVSKKARMDDGTQDEEGSDSDEEDWQRDAAGQLAAEAEEQQKRKEGGEKEESDPETQGIFGTKKFVMPQEISISIEEGRALFKTLLREKDINPLHPWDMSLPKFVNDPRYVLLPSIATRREAFDEYCKERARELKQSSLKKDKQTANPKDAFERLLRDEVGSTRSSWTDFRKMWKTDRRFYGWGRDDREREKRFRTYLKELGEQKRHVAQKAEADFFALLKETKGATEMSNWKEVKKNIYKDPRYDAVGSSSLREELFNTFLKGLVSGGKESDHTKSNIYIKVEASTDEGGLRENKTLRAVREREERVKAGREMLNSEIERSKMGINMEEGERNFLTLLTDAIRDPRAKWDQVQPQLMTDPRFTNCPLPVYQQVQLFHKHVSQVRSKQLDNLQALFRSNAPSLANHFNELPLQSILSSLPATRLGFSAERLEDEFRKFQRERRAAARKAFDEMLFENSFVEFWGRLGKMGASILDTAVRVEDDDIGEVDDEKVDMKTLAKNIDIGEMEKVLKNDKRYTVFDHIPEQRQEWLRDYLSQLSAPKSTVHLPD